MKARGPENLLNTVKAGTLFLLLIPSIYISLDIYIYIYSQLMIVSIRIT